MTPVWKQYKMYREGKNLKEKHVCIAACGQDPCHVTIPLGKDPPEKCQREVRDDQDHYPTMSRLPQVL